MPTEFENFSARFIEGLLRNSPKNTNYVLNTTLVSVWREAMRTPDSASYQYPPMMYRGSTEQRTVQNAHEEQAAATEGFSRNAPLPDPRYPLWYSERPVAMGGTKVWDLRRVEIRSSAEEQQFFAYYKLGKHWMLDGVTSQWGARGVSLATLVEEGKEARKRLIDQDLLEFVEPGSDNVGHEDSGTEAGDTQPSAGASPE